MDSHIPYRSVLKKEKCVLKKGRSVLKKRRKVNYLGNKKVLKAPHMSENLFNPTSSMAREMTSTLNEEIETHNILNNESNSSNNTQKNVFVDPQLQRGSQMLPQSQPEIPRAEGSSSSWSSSSNEINDYQDLEDLVGSHWEQDAAFFIEQAENFEYATMFYIFNSIYKLKRDNVILEDEIDTLTRRPDHLLAVNARLAIPNTPQSRRNQSPAPPVTNNQNGGPVQLSRSKFQTNGQPAHPLSNDTASQVVRGGGGITYESRSGNRKRLIRIEEY